MTNLPANNPDPRKTSKDPLRGWKILDDAPAASNGGWSVVEDEPVASGWDAVPVAGQAKASGWDAVPVAGQSQADPWQPTQYGFKVKSAKLPNGAQTLEREDGAVWQSAKTGYKGQDGEGWKYLDPKTNLYAPAPDTLGQNKYLGADSWKGFGRNLAQGLSRPGDAVLGLGHDIAHAVGMEGDQAYLKNIQNMEEREKYRQAVKNTSGQGAGATQLIGETLPTVVAMAAVPGAPAGSTFIQKAASNALSGAGATYLTTPGSGLDRTKAAVAALVTAPIAQGIIEKGVAPLTGKAIHSLSGTKLGDLLGIPPGLIPNVKNIPEDLLQKMVDTPYIGLREVKTVAAGSSKRAPAARALLEQLEAAGQDDSRVLQTSMGLRAFQEKLKSDALFSRRDALASAITDVPLTNTLKSLDEAIDAAKKSRWPGSENTVTQLEAFKSRLTSSTNSFQELSQTRSDIGSAIRSFYSGRDALTGSGGVDSIQGIKNALSTDLVNAAQNSGNPALVTADRAARENYSRLAGTLKDPSIISAINSTEPDQILGAFVKAGKGDRAQKLFDALDPKGRAAASYGITLQAMQKAENEVGNFIPGKFVKAMKDQTDAYGVFFRGEDKWSMDGFTRLMKDARFVGQLIPSGKLIPALDTSVLAKALFMTGPGRRALLSASSLPPGSPAMGKLIDSLPKITGMVAGRSNSSSAQGGYPASDPDDEEMQ